MYEEEPGSRVWMGPTGQPRLQSCPMMVSGGEWFCGSCFLEAAQEWRITMWSAGAYRVSVRRWAVRRRKAGRVLRGSLASTMNGQLEVRLHSPAARDMRSIEVEEMKAESVTKQFPRHGGSPSDGCEGRHRFPRRVPQAWHRHEGGQSIISIDCLTSATVTSTCRVVIRVLTHDVDDHLKWKGRVWCS